MVADLLVAILKEIAAPAVNNHRATKMVGSDYLGHKEVTGHSGFFDPKQSQSSHKLLCDRSFDMPVCLFSSFLYLYSFSYWYCSYCMIYVTI